MAAQPSAPRTRLADEKEAMNRQAIRLRVEKHRLAQHPQKKRRVLEKQRQYYYKKKAETQLRVSQLQQRQEKGVQAEKAFQASGCPYPSQKAFMRAARRVKGKLRAKGVKLAYLVKAVLKSSSKETKKKLKELNVSFNTPEKNPPSPGESLTKHVAVMSAKRDKATLQHKRRLSEAFCETAGEIGLSARYRKAAKNRHLYEKRKENAAQNKFRAFFFEHSHPDPCKKSKKRQLLRPVKDLHREFCSTHPEVKASCRSFYRWKPQDVASVKKVKFRQCLCDVCLNPKLKLERLNRLLTTKFENVRQLLNESVCCFESQPKLNCVERKCSECGVERVRMRLHGELEGSLGLNVSWRKWELVREGKSSRIDQVKKTGSVRDCLNELCEELDHLFVHVFVAEWQRKQLQKLKAELPEGWALVTCDFAENFLCRFQDEPQSAHWAYKQVSLFPAVVFLPVSKRWLWRVEER